ncbi:MAG: hypothetical protein M0T70_10430 [Geobacteraceae bacterium]|nr:hypothetical protein [Geobacteraceae bacterium]
MKNEQSSTHLHITSSHVIGRMLSVAVALFMMAGLIQSAWASGQPSPARDASGYEIPLGELNKVKKVRQVKKGTRVHKKRKRVSTPLPSNDVAVPPAAKVVQTPAAATAVPNGSAQPMFHQPAAPEKTIMGIASPPPPARPPADSVSIHHDPYSYVITGKRTTIQAVVSSAENIQAVYCRFRAAENGAYARVPMVQVPGTHFTYSATLPGLAAASRSLRYSIIAVDALGHETSSQEYVIAVKPSDVLPGWQLENSPGPIKIRLDDPAKPLEGFSDPGITE